MTAPDTRTGPRLERTTFHTSRALDFCNEKGLITETGHQPEVWPLVVVKELIDNALDAAEEVGTLPALPSAAGVSLETAGVEFTNDDAPGVRRRRRR